MKVRAKMSIGGKIGIDDGGETERIKQKLGELFFMRPDLDPERVTLKIKELVATHPIKLIDLVESVYDKACREENLGVLEIKHATPQSTDPPEGDDT